MLDDLSQRERADKVNAACRWYRANVAVIRSLLPLQVPHGGESRGFSLYQENWNPECWIEKWESKDSKFSLEEAERLISDQLRPLFPIVLKQLTSADN